MSPRARARVVLVVPPFAGIDRPALGPHLLQACARSRGVDVRVFYANVRFAALIGEDLYHRICYGPTAALPGERVFARAAFDVPWRTDTALPEDLDFEQLSRIEEQVDRWVEAVTGELLELEPEVVGCSTTFQQTCASFAILRFLKRRAPRLVTLLGGSNCEGEMAHGLAELGGPVDHVFSGECEEAFPDFLVRLFASGERPAARVIEGNPCEHLDALPRADFADFYAQLEEQLPGSALLASKRVWLPYESSRGCWWGQKQHCTFCGLNGQALRFREKSAERVVGDLSHLLRRHPSALVSMVDKIMPRSFFKTVIPALARDLPGLHLFYEQKANLTLENVLALQRAGVAVIQPGIEALDTELLRLMRKGVTAAQNVALLRYCRMAGVAVNWNLLYGFPSDRHRWYAQTHDLAPLLHHLHPPAGASPLVLARFSEYHASPEAYGIRELAPFAAYRDVFPDGAPIGKIAYQFEGSYPSEARGESGAAELLRDAVRSWRAAWGNGALPVLEVTPLVPGSYLLTDTRAVAGRPRFEVIDERRARAALLGDAADPATRAWVEETKVAVALDGRLVPLATCEPELFQELIASGAQDRRPGAP